MGYSPVDPAWGPPTGLPARLSADLPLAPGPSPSGTPGAVLNTAVYANGFLPGEEACIAFIMSGTFANQAGDVSIQIPRLILEYLPTGEVIIFGRTSGTLTVRQPLLDS